jgi:hypothetical protein
MWLRHLVSAVACVLAGKKFYAPVEQLTEIPLDLETFLPDKKVKQRG